MHDQPTPAAPIAADSAEATPTAAASTAPDATTLRAAEWERMVRIRGARHAGPSARRTNDERPR